MRAHAAMHGVLALPAGELHLHPQPSNPEGGAAIESMYLILGLWVFKNSRER